MHRFPAWHLEEVAVWSFEKGWLYVGYLKWSHSWRIGQCVPETGASRASVEWVQFPFGVTEKDGVDVCDIANVPEAMAL
jgi:hypothetical protein